MSPGLIEFTWDLAKTGGAGYVEPVGAASPSGWVDTFIRRHVDHKPVAGVNVGAGIYEARPIPTVTADAKPGVTWNSSNKEFTVAPGVLVQDVVFPGFVNLGDQSRLLNFLVTGPDAEVTNTRALVQGPSTTGRATIEFGTIDPNVASAYYDGFGRGITARRTAVKNVVDGIRGFSTSINGARILAEDCAFTDPVRFAPDYVNNRAETHNDTLIQFQGNPNGTNDDIVMDNCAANARHSMTKGDVPNLPADHKQIAAVMFTPQNSVGAAHGRIIYCWLEGGIYCVNAGSDAPLMTSSSLEISYTRFERPGTDTYGDGRAPTIALAVDSRLQFVGVGNTYIDNGAPVPVTNA